MPQIYERWVPIPGFDREMYIRNCQKMIGENQKQVDLWLEKIENEKDRKKREQLELELEGWEAWVQRWTTWLEDATANDAENK